MTVFSIKKDASLAISAFTSVDAAKIYDSSREIFASFGELAASDLSDEDLRTVHYIVKGHETRLTDREWLSEIIYTALLDAGLPVIGDDDRPQLIANPEPEIVVEAPEEIVEVVSDIEPEPEPEPEPEYFDEDRDIDEPVSAATKALFLKLNQRPRTKYSRRERILFEILANNYPEMTTTQDIIQTGFLHSKSFHIKNAIVTAISHLKKKIAFNGEPFRIVTTGNSGPYPMKVWIKLNIGRRNENASNVWRTKNETA